MKNFIDKYNLTLAKKISLGFGVVLMGLGGLSCLSWNAIEDAGSGFAEYREMARDASLISHLESDMLMVRMNVKDYLITGSEKDVAQYEGYHHTMDEYLKKAKSEINDPERARLVAMIAKDVKDYDVAFKQVVAKRELRNALVDEQLNVNGPLLEEKLSEVMLSAEKDKDVEAAFNAGVTLKHLLLGRLYIAKFLNTNDESAAVRVREEFKKMDHQFEALAASVEHVDRQKLLGEIDVLRKDYEHNFELLVDVIHTRNEIITGELDKIGPEIAGLAKDIKHSLKSVQEDIGPRVEEANHLAEAEIIWASIAVMFFGITIAIVISRAISKPLRQMPITFKKIADGDLTQRLDEVRQDEIGECAKWFNLLIQKQQDIIGDISTSAERLNGSSEDLSETAATMTTGVDSMNQQTATVAAAAEEMTINMQNMSTSSEEMTLSIRNVASAVTQMNQSISAVSTNANQTSVVASRAAELAGESNKNITGLGEAAEEIGKVITVIQAIAEQTNLLALNATIEAARAGDAGKGFAVVATEVKALASQTAEATLNIGQRISAIQSSAAESIASIGEINTVIGEVSELSTSIATAVEQQSISSQEIASNVEQVALASESVTEGVSESAKATEEITKTITGVSGVARQSAQGASDTERASQNVSGLAEDLKLLVGQFKV